MAEPSKEGKKPEHKIRYGCVTCTIWRNEQKGDKGEYEFRTFQVERNYKDGEEWKTSSSFNLADLPKVGACVQDAYEWHYANPLKSSVQESE